MDKRERLERTLMGEATDRVPVALWRHWPGDDQRAADFARYTVGFQRAYDWDFIKVSPFSAFSVHDYGVQSQWMGDLSGDRTLSKHVVARSLDWTDLRPLDPLRGEMGKYVEALRLMLDALGDEAETTPIVATLYSPLSQAAQIAGQDLFLRHLRTEADRLQSGLNALTESLLRLVAELRRIGIAGVYYVMDQANYTRLSVPEYQTFGVAYDRKVIDSFPEKWWLNVLHPAGDTPMFELAATYPFPVIHGSMRPKDITAARGQYHGALMGGVGRNLLNLDTPTPAKDTARQIMLEMDKRRLILSTDETAFLSTPRANLRTMRESVEPI